MNINISREARIAYKLINHEFPRKARFNDN